MTDLIERLSDEDAVVALAYVLDLESLSMTETAELERLQGGLPEAFAGDGSVVPWDGQVDSGELARSALRYLAEQDGVGREAVAEAVANPPAAGNRDPVTLAVAGLVLVALRTEVDLQRDRQGRWSFRFRVKPVRDSVLGTLLAKLARFVGQGGN